MSATSTSLSARKQAITLITGASGGIGEALAHEFARDGQPLALVARDVAELQRVANDLRKGFGVKVMVIAADLQDPSASAQIQDALAAERVYVHTLVNNAGFGLKGDVAEMDREGQLAMLDLNVRALTELTHRFLAPMLDRSAGAILNVASTAAFQPGPRMAVYYASKSYVLSFTEALAHELKNTGVSISALCPGPTPSGFQARANMEDARLVTMMPTTSVGQVAKAGYKGLKKGKRVIIPGFTNALLARSAPLIPAFIKLPLVRYLQA